MLNAGFPFVEAVRLLAKTSERHRVKQTASELARLVDQGANFKVALEQTPDLPDLIRGMLLMGQRSGSITHLLDAVIEHYAWMMELRGRVWQLVAYPYILVVFGALIMVARDTAIAAIQTGSSAAAAGSAFDRYMMPVIIYSALGALLGRALHWKPLGLFVGAITIHLPLVRTASLAVFFNTLSVALDCGMPVVMAWELAAKSVSNSVVSDRLLAWTRFLKDGESLATTLKMTGVVNKEAIAMVTIGEHSASTPMLMRKLSTWYNERIRTTIMQLVRCMAPFLVFAVAGGYFMNPMILAYLAFFLALLIAFTA